MEDSYRVLTEAGMKVSGSPSQQATLEVKGLRIKLLAFGFNAGMLDVKDIAGAVKLVKDASASHDQVWVSAHWGAEGAGADRVTRQTEIGFGENRGNPYK